MNFCDIAIHDLETGSRNPETTQILQIACVILDNRTLQIKENGIFQSLVRPIEDENELEKLGLAKVEQEALDVNNLKIEDLRKAPELKFVLERFTAFLDIFNVKKDPWFAPIRCGFNNNGFDNKIIDRDFKRFGFWDKEKGKIKHFHPAKNIDVWEMLYPWFENIKMERNSTSMDSLRQYFGMSKEGAHNALVDVYDTAEIYARFMKMYRYFMSNGLIELEGRMKDNRSICIPPELLTSIT